MDNLNSIDLLGNSSIGIFAFSTNSYALIPQGIKSNVLQTIKSTLKVPIVQSTIANCHLLGLFACGNTNNLLIPDLVSEDEHETLSSGLPDNVKVHTLNSRITALGNAIVCSDKVAIIHNDFTNPEVKEIEDVLGVEAIQQKVIGSSLVGSLIFRSDNGFLTHPLLTYDEMEWLSKIFNTPGDVVTVNRGTPYPRPGIVGNNNGILIGSDSSGPELMRIYEVLLG